LNAESWTLGNSIIKVRIELMLRENSLFLLLPYHRMSLLLSLLAIVGIGNFLGGVERLESWLLLSRTRFDSRSLNEIRIVVAWSVHQKNTQVSIRRKTFFIISHFHLILKNYLLGDNH
jgi:hypothetical protein